MNLRAALRQLPPEQLMQLQGELPQSKGPILSKLATAVGQPVTASDIAGTPELLKLVMAGGAKYASADRTQKLTDGGGRAQNVLAQFQFAPASLGFESVKAGLHSVHPKEVRAAERLFADGHALQERHYPGLWSGNGPVGGEVEDLKVARAYPDRTDIDWDRLVERDRQGKAISELDRNLMTSLSGEFKLAAFEHGSSEQGPKKAQAFFLGVEEQARAMGAQLLITEMNLPGAMTKEELTHDLKDRPYARADHIDFMCGDPADKKHPGMGFKMVGAPNGGRALYGQLAFEGEDPVMHLALGVKVLDPKLLVDGKLPTKVYLEAIKTYFSTFENVKADAERLGIPVSKVVEMNPTFTAIEASVSGSPYLDLLGAEAVSKQTR